MKAKLISGLNRAADLVMCRFRYGIPKPDAIGISIFLHITVAAAFASFYVGGIATDKLSQTPTLELELVSTPDLLIEKPVIESDKSDQVRNCEASPAVSKAIGSLMSESKILIAEDAVVNKRAIMMASLSTLSELRESFRFVAQQVSADSSGIFTPIRGDAPNTSIFSDGALDGYAGGRSGVIRIGGGAGKCPPGGGGIYQ